jgi:hypothetical protein
MPDADLITLRPAAEPAGRRLAAFTARLDSARRRWRAVLAVAMSPDGLWPYAALLSPLVITSVLAPLWLSFMMGLLSLLALHRAAPLVPDGRRAFFFYVLPLQALLAVWVAASAAAGQGQAIAATVFPYLAVLCLLIAPACRWDRSRTARRVPLRWSLPVLMVLAVLAHGSAALHAMGVL